MDRSRQNQDMTRLLRDWADGDRAAEEELISLVYTDLRRLAASLLRAERDGHTLQPTDLVHQAFCKLVGSTLPAFENRSHFFTSPPEACVSCWSNMLAAMAGGRG